MCQYYVLAYKNPHFAQAKLRNFCLQCLQPRVNPTKLRFNQFPIFAFKAELRQSFSTCVYCMRLHFRCNDLGWLKPG